MGLWPVGVLIPGNSRFDGDVLRRVPRLIVSVAKDVCDVLRELDENEKGTCTVPPLAVLKKC